MHNAALSNSVPGSKAIARTRVPNRRFPFFLPDTLFWRISAVLVLLLFGVSASLFLLLFNSWRHASDRALQTVLAGAAQDVRPRLEPFVTYDSAYSDAVRAAHEIIAINPMLEIYLLTSTGTLINRYARIGQVAWSRSVSTQPIEAFLRGEALPIYGDDPGEPGQKVIFSASRISVRGEDGILYIVLRSSAFRTALQAFVEEAGGRDGLITSASITVAALAVGLFLVFYLTRRFGRVTEMVGRYQTGDFTERLAVRGSDQIDQLASAVNQMADTIVANIATLEERDRLRREFVSGVSHDLRGPVANLKTYSSSLNVESLRHNATAAADLLEVLEASTGALDSLLHELFELSVLETGERLPQFIRFDLGDLVEEAVLNHGASARQKSLTLECRLPDALPRALGDVAMIARVLANLVSNAIRYTPEGGKITVRAESSGSHIRVSVIDTGIGIPAEDLSKVFQRFHRASNVSSSASGATGLGLAIVQRIMELHNSKITVESKINEGTVFSFILESAD